MKNASAPPRLPKALSEGEEAFALHCRAEGLYPLTEYHFHPERKWRFDYCFVAEKIAVEVDGGTWIAGRHNRGSSIEKDYEKLNAAAKLGWVVLRYSTAMVLRGDAIADVLEMLK